MKQYNLDKMKSGQRWKIHQIASDQIIEFEVVYVDTFSREVDSQIRYRGALVRFDNGRERVLTELELDRAFPA